MMVIRDTKMKQKQQKLPLDNPKTWALNLGFRDGI